MQTTSMIDLSHLRLFTMGDAETEKMMLGEIVNELMVESAQIRTLVRDANWQALARVTHKLKTTLPFIGNKELIDLNLKVEHASRNNQDHVAIPAWTDQFLALLPEVIAELESMI
jgi:HPt (histidine-containing phosphotransfer) domain-containing protein